MTTYNDCDCVPGHRCDCWDYRATPLSEEATDVRYHDPSVCGFSSAHISTDPKVHTTAEERLSPPSEEAMSITSHVTVGQCSCGEHHGATPPFEEAPGLDEALKRVRALTFPYAPGDASAPYENGWYDGRGAAVRVLQDLTSSDGGRDG